MTKKIYVTVAEFLENGGELILADGSHRRLYNKNKIHFELDAGMYKLITETQPKDFYVQIDCTPIYK